MKKIIISLSLFFALAPTALVLSSTLNIAEAATCNFDATSKKLCNPLPVNNLNSAIVKGLQFLIGIIGTIAVVVIVFAGFRMVMSQGNSEAVGDAKKSITWAVAGLAVSMLAYTIVAIVSNTLTSAGK